ncbi:MAG: hypothetical protein MZW92_36300 [Comamonadaceae bacterium]|nr:hypothetical protein [Comamonadaceae bacterium]
MGGYDYQIWRSIEAWLTLGDTEVLYLEGAEDLDRVSHTDTTTVQVRRTRQPLTLNAQAARDALRNYLADDSRPAASLHPLRVPHDIERGA